MRKHGAGRHPGFGLLIPVFLSALSHHRGRVPLPPSHRSKRPKHPSLPACSPEPLSRAVGLLRSSGSQLVGDGVFRVQKPSIRFKAVLALSFRLNRPDRPPSLLIETPNRPRAWFWPRVTRLLWVPRVPAETQGRGEGLRYSWQPSRAQRLGLLLPRPAQLSYGKPALVNG
jgi:hypothetical protein